MSRPGRATRRIFSNVLAHFRFQVPGAPAVTLHSGRSEDFPGSRDMAYAEGAGHGPYRITVTPGFHLEPEARQQGVLCHELAHVALLAAGRIEHSEREADAMAETLFWPHRIYYDADDVQTVDLSRMASRYRPDHLPK